MNFLSPAALWFLGLIAPVVVFYLLKRRRTVKLVASTLLWQRFLAENQANAPFQKLRKNWLLLLQILLLLLAVFALTRPYFSGETKVGRLRVVILDASASMQATDESPNRFEKARSEALALVDSLRDDDQMVVLVAGASTEVRQSATSGKAALRRAIAGAAATDSPTRLKDAIKLSDTLARAALPPADTAGATNAALPNAEIHLFTDGAVGDLSEFENKGLNIVYHRVGQRGNNAGIVQLDLRQNPENRRQRALYVSVGNYSSNALDSLLELRLDNQLLEARPIKVPSGETAALVFLPQQTKDGVFHVKLAAEDDLAVDNEAFIPSILPRPIRVLLVSKGNRFLEKALRAAPEVELAVATDLSAAPNGFDLLVLDDVLPSTWPKIPTLAIRTAPTNWFDASGSVEAPAMVDWRGSHPLLRYVNFDAVQVADTTRIKTPSWAQSIVEATETPLIIAGELEGRRIVWIGFDTLNSTWPLRISFPIFVANAVEWLNPSPDRAGQMVVRPGDPWRAPLASDTAKATLTLPDGTKKELVPVAGQRELVIGDTTHRGVYRFTTGTNETVFTASLLDSAESNIRPRDQLSVGKLGEVAANTERNASKELWRWIAVAALGVLMFEWWFYHRRTA